MLFLLTYSGTVILSHLALPRLTGLLQKGGLMRINHRGVEVVQSAGFIFPLIGTLLLILSPVLPDPSLRTAAVVLWGGTWAMSALGVIDDLCGDHEEKGWLAHGRALLRGRMTAGGMKLMGGGLTGLGMGALLQEHPWLALQAGVLLALAANTMNLLDLRPGRAIKVFLSLSVLFWLWQGWPRGAILLAPFLATASVFLADDLAERVMLGDAGANALGLSLGLLVVLETSAVTQAFRIGGLLLLQVMAERFSLSRMFEKSPVLAAFDHWGRPDR